MSVVRAAVRSTRRAAIRSARAALRVAISPTMMRSRAMAGLWGAAVSAPGVPDRARGEIADLVHAGLLRAGRPAQAAQAMAAALPRMRNRRLRADILALQAKAELETSTPASLPAALSAELAFADGFLAKHNIRGAAASLQAASRQVFDRRLHFDRLTSPLADDAERFLATWHHSSAVRALTAPRGRGSTPGPLPTDRPVRLLMVTYGNHGFLNLIRRHFERMPDVEVRFLDPGEEVGVPHVALLNNTKAMMEHILAGRSPYGDKVAQWLKPHLEWADVAFIDWCAALAVLFTMLDPGSTRIIVRLHSFETFALWPHMVDFSRVDDVIFVSDHLRDLGVAAIPALAGTAPHATEPHATEPHASEAHPTQPRLHVLTNAMDLRAYRRAKNPGARFTVGVVGIKAVAKDPQWAVDVIRRLRERDDRYRLVFFGHDLNPGTSPDAKLYWERFLADIADLELAGAVVRMGQVDDVPSALSDVGVIVSSSVRESFHCGLVEGAASAAVPVVRDWPFFAGKAASARGLFPANWVVDTAEQAAERILAVTATEEVWREAGEAASAHAIATWDWEIVKDGFTQLVLSGVPTRL